MTAGLTAIPKEDSQSCLQQWYCHWNKYIHAEWQYFEGGGARFSIYSSC